MLRFCAQNKESYSVIPLEISVHQSTAFFFSCFSFFRRRWIVGKSFDRFFFHKDYFIEEVRRFYLYIYFLRNYWWLLMIDLYWFSFRHFRLNWFFDQRNVVLRGRGNIYCSRGNELCKLLVRCVQRRQPVFMHLWEV